MVRNYINRMRSTENKNRNGPQLPAEEDIIFDNTPITDRRNVINNSRRSI